MTSPSADSVPPGPVRVDRIRLGPTVAHYPAGATFGPRRIPDFEFVWVLSGGAEWTCEERSVDLQPGTLLLVRPGEHHHFTWDVSRPTLHAYVHFSLRGGDAGPLGDAERWPVTRRFADTDPAVALCHYLLRLGTPEDQATLARIQDVLAFLLTLFVQGAAPAETRDDVASNAYIEPIVAHLRRTWSDGVTTPVPLGELAKLAGISAGHLSRVFRRYFGLGPIHALELIRLARAATLLQRSNLAVSGVATACGFTNPFHFSRRFRRVYGVPPRTYIACGEVDPLHPLARAGLLPLAQRVLLDA